MPANPSYLRSSELISRADSRLLIVDVQEKLVPAIPTREALIRRCAQLIRGAQILQVPVQATEQYPKGLGHTVPQLAELLPERSEKVRFSCAESLGWGNPAEDDTARFQVVVAGMEAHVCVLQTVLDLIGQGFQVFVPADAVASRTELDWQFALQRMAASGAVITTSESVLFEWCEVAGTPEFKKISELIKTG